MTGTMLGLNRIFFTGADLANVRVGSHFGPLAETAFSLERLFGRSPSVPFDPWRRSVAPHVNEATHALGRLFPWALDLGTTAERSPSLDAGLERFRARPSGLVAGELEASATNVICPPDWARGLAAHGPRERVAGALRAYHETAIEPYWPVAHQILEAETARAARRLGELGVVSFLGSLSPHIAWQGPVLEVHCAIQWVHDCHLEGRGLDVVPSLFCPAGFPLWFGYDPDAPPVLFYPVELGPEDVARLWALDGVPPPQSLAALLGRTRASVLDILAAAPATTSELARRGGMSLSSASEHASVLRAAGLVASRRQGTAVVHSATPLGLQLLGGGWRSCASE